LSRSLLAGDPTTRDSELQERYFDRERNQYGLEAVLSPPLHTVHEMQCVLERLVRAGVEGHVVDFGAGTGRLTVALGRAGYRVTAVDVSAESLAVLKTAVRTLDMPSVRISRSLPEDRCCEAVVGCDVLHHVILDECLPSIRNSLRPRGSVVFSEPGALNPTWYLYLGVRHDFRIEKRIVTCNIPYLRRKFAQHGFRNVRITGLGVLPRPLFGWSPAVCSFHDRLGNAPVLRWFAYRYIVEATT
jgi:2-polyprenyl-3-methyl-5-hydroxy-6-metoxy-1,4-benzoquinol methylase